MTRAFLATLVAAVVAAGIWTGKRAPAGLLPSPRRPYQGDGSPQVRTEPFVSIGLMSAWLQSRTMDLLLLGEPHAASRGVDVEGSKRILLFTAAIAGAAFLIACDIAARTARPPAEIRLGVVTALCGAPLFLVILLKRLRGEAR